VSHPDGALTGEPIDPNVVLPSRYVSAPDWAAQYGRPLGVYQGPARSTRPGNVMASIVLSYVTAALLILAALLLFLGATLVAADAGTSGGYGSELAVDAVIDIVITVLLVSGAVMMTARRAAGRVLLTVASVLCAGAGIYWAVRVPTQGVAFYVILFSSLPVVGAALAWTPSAARWLATASHPS
jgi:hypothetical protein